VQQSGRIYTIGLNKVVSVTGRKLQKSNNSQLAGSRAIALLLIREGDLISKYPLTK
jgi:hypothetical protein